MATYKYTQIKTPKLSTWSISLPLSYCYSILVFVNFLDRNGASPPPFFPDNGLFQGRPAMLDGTGALLAGRWTSRENFSAVFLPSSSRYSRGSSRHFVFLPGAQTPFPHLHTPLGVGTSRRRTTASGGEEV